MKTTPTNEAINSELAIPPEVLSGYFNTDHSKITALGEGMINTTYLVITGSYPFVLQRLGKDFGTEIAEDFEQVTAHLARQGWEVPVPISAHDKQPHRIDNQGKLWRAMSYIESDPKNPEQLDATTLWHTGFLLAQLHQSLARLDYKPKFSLPHFHDTAHYASQLEAHQPTLPTPEAKTLAANLLEAYKTLPKSNDEATQLIHGDPRTGNMLFRDGKPFTFIDFDTLMVGSVWLDIGDLLRSLAEDALLAGGELPIADLQNVCEGYRLIDQPDAEPAEFISRALQAMQHIALELGMRFVDDIDGDYFSFNPADYANKQEFAMARAQLQWQIYSQAAKTIEAGELHV